MVASTLSEIHLGIDIGIEMSRAFEILPKTPFTITLYDEYEWQARAECLAHSLDSVHLARIAYTGALV